MKLKDILIPNREGLEKKWWHRLAQVLIFGGAIITFIFSVIYFFTNTDEWKSSRHIYSFEKGYSQNLSFSRGCEFVAFNENILPNINCGDYHVYDQDLTAFLEHYENYHSNLKFFTIQNGDSVFNFETGEYINCDASLKKFFLCEKNRKVINLEFLNEKIKQGEFNNLKAKTVIYADVLFLNIGVIIFLPLLWFIFWESIVYRVILYIAFGKKK